MSLRLYLEENGVSEHTCTVLQDHEVDLEVFKVLTHEEFKSMLPCKIGAVRKLLLLQKRALEGDIQEVDVVKSSCVQSNPLTFLFDGEDFYAVSAVNEHSSSAHRKEIYHTFQADNNVDSQTSETEVSEAPDPDTPSITTREIHPEVSATTSSPAEIGGGSSASVSHPGAASEVLSAQTVGEVKVLQQIATAVDTLIPLPQYSIDVELALRTNKILPLFDQLIEETAHHIMKHGDFKCKTQYFTFCRNLYSKYHAIGFPGKNPWSFFSQKLSRKRRNTRYAKNKLCTPRISRANSASSHAGISGVKRELPIENAKIELEAERVKELPSREKLMNFFKYLHGVRREEIRKSQSSPSVLTKAYPLLRELPFMREELSMIIQRNEEQMIELYTEMMRKLDILFRNDSEAESARDGCAELHLLLKLQESLVDKRVKDAGSSDVIAVAEAHQLYLNCNQNDPLTLLLARHQNGSYQGWVTGDGIILSCGPPSNELSRFVLDLMASYYAWDLRYPKIFPILNFLHVYVLGQALGSARPSTKYSIFERRYLEA